MSTTVPGLSAKHAIIRDACRARGDVVAVDAAIERLRVEALALCMAWPEGKGHRLHLVLTIERGS